MGTAQATWASRTPRVGWGVPLRRFHNRRKSDSWPNSVTESKLTLLASRQANKSRVGAKNTGFIQKASRLRGWWTCVPKTHFARVRIQASFILFIKEEEIKSNISWFPSGQC